MTKTRNELGLDADDAPTLVDLPSAFRGRLDRSLKRDACIEALAGTLQELHSMNALHAERGLKTVRGFLHMLTGSIRERRATTYTAKGLTRSDAEVGNSPSAL